MNRRTRPPAGTPSLLGPPRARPRRGISLGTIALFACGGAPLAAQPPPPPVPQSPAPAPPAPADTTAPAAVPQAGDTAAAAVRADSAAVYHRFSLAEYGARVLGPRALARGVVLAGLGQAAKRPTEWRRTWGGYGDRLSSRLGTQAIAQAVTLGVSAALDERPGEFSRCYCVGTGPRLWHAALTPWQMNSPTGTHTSPIAPMSEIASSILITSVQPRGFSVRDGLRSGAFGILGTSGFAILREFWPWHKRPFGL